MAHDFWLGIRSLARRPAVLVVSVLTMGAGLAGIAAAFSLLDAALFQVVPADEPDRLVSVTEISLESGDEVGVSSANFNDWRDAASSFGAIALLSDSEYTINMDGAYPELVFGMQVSRDFFPAFGRFALRGRVLEAEDFESEASVVVVSHGFWKTRMGGREDIQNAPIVLEGRPHRVVGVMPADFNFTRLPNSTDRVEFWLPRDLKSELRRMRRSARLSTVIGRLDPGVSLERARAELQAISKALAERFPESNRGFGVRLRPLRDAMAEGSRTALWLLFGAFGLAWLVCVVNVANLMLSRSIAREGEMAVRAALGATRYRLARLLLAEALVVAAGAGVLAAVLAPWALQAMHLFNVGAWPEVSQAKLDGRTFVFMGLMALLSSLLGAALSVVRSCTRHPANDALLGRVASGTRKSGRLAAALVVSEVALATVLCAGAGLMLKSFVELGQVEVGFEAERVLTFDLILPKRGHDLRAMHGLLRQTLESIESLPGVARVSQGTRPLSGLVSYPVELPSRSQPILVKLAAVDSMYFQVLGIPVLEGRDFQAGDREDSPPVAVISKSLADELFPGQNPIGLQLKLSGKGEPLRRIVGVVGDVRRSGPESSPSSDLYLPQPQIAWLISRAFLVKAEKAGGRDLPQALPRAIAELDDSVAVRRLAWLEDELSDTWREKRTMGLLLSSLAALALALALLGLYSVMSVHVSLRRSEIGLRMALGAGPSLIFGWVVFRGGRMLLVGLAAGLSLSLWLSQFLAGFLFQVSPLDPVSLALVAAAVSAGALAACTFPAQRAARVDPMQVLRNE